MRSGGKDAGSARDRVAESRVTRAWLFAPLLAVIVQSAGAWQQRPNFVDRSGNMEIRNGTSFIYEPTESGIAFEGKGKPLIATWKKQGLRIEAAEVKGQAERVSAGEFKLISASLTGNVRVQREAPSAARTQAAVQTGVLTCASATYDSETELWTLTGGVAYRLEDPAAGKFGSFSGSKAALGLYSPDESKDRRAVLKTAELFGPANFEMRNRRAVPVPGDPKRTQQQVFSIKGRGDHLSYRQAEGVLTLTGNVFIEGNDPALMGDIAATKAVLYFREDGSLKRVEMEGDPGLTRISPKPPPEGSAR